MKTLLPINPHQYILSPLKILSLILLPFPWVIGDDELILIRQNKGVGLIRPDSDDYDNVEWEDVEWEGGQSPSLLAIQEIRPRSQSVVGVSVHGDDCMKGDLSIASLDIFGGWWLPRKCEQNPRTIRRFGARQ